ncbi:hypothetical protein SD71_19025 [Cohnella kolymensis]|uniref:Uncharacterized protein n=1 Tax=Cohnella kolymensis TaxID=1590652 RepID=A0ABR5A0G6_9BACL|nr:hypothetical protein SD71_19025 [Cohnella kolymensis]
MELRPSSILPGSEPFDGFSTGTFDFYLAIPGRGLGYQGAQQFLSDPCDFLDGPDETPPRSLLKVR